MGHSRIGTLPCSRPWRGVVALLTAGASAEAVAAATAAAADRALTRNADDLVLRHAFYLLTQIPLAARSDDMVGALRRLGILVGPKPSLFEIGASVSEALDRLRANAARQVTDLSELASLAAVESLLAVTGHGTRDLFGLTDTPEDAQRSLARLATAKQFGVLGRDFLARLLRRGLEYYLSRELPNHVGRDRRFHSLADHRAFEQAIDAHCRETARIAEMFAAEWFSKTTYEGGITPEKAGRFIHVAFHKLRDELRIRGPRETAPA